MEEEEATFEDANKDEDVVTQDPVLADQQNVSTDGRAEHLVTTVVIDAVQKRMNINTQLPQKKMSGLTTRFA